MKEHDARDLCGMMTLNADIFQRFFPNTLARNLTLADSRAYIHRKSEEIGKKIEFTFAIRNQNGKVIGLIILKNIKWDIGQGELAYCLERSQQGKGIVSDSVRQVSQIAFREHHLKKLKIFAHKSNIASIKVAEKAGFYWSKTLSNAYRPPNGEAVDMEIYEMDYER
ncbi:MAG: GNAT family N-acetyltransferase [Flavobacteriaceae bacterium]|nr:GNAT family N-acetyltransferase [Flavobacteriaceae bacterium]